MTGIVRRALGVVEVAVALDQVPGADIRFGVAELAAADPAGLVVRLENRLHGLETVKAKAAAEIDRIEGEAACARDDLVRPFSLSRQLTEARARVAGIRQQLEEAARRSARADGEPVTEGVKDHDRDTSEPARANGSVTAAGQNQAQPPATVASRSFPAGQVVVAVGGSSALVTRLAAGANPGQSRVR